MTGAPVPRGADAVVMVEHVIRGVGDTVYDRPRCRTRAVHQSRKDAKRAAGEVAAFAWQAAGLRRYCTAGHRGQEHVAVCPRPRVALLATGDEIVADHRDAARVPDPQLQRLFAGCAGDARRRRPDDSAGRARRTR